VPPFLCLLALFFAILRVLLTGAGLSFFPVECLVGLFGIAKPQKIQISLNCCRSFFYILDI
jgi:hypothetical protein